MANTVIILDIKKTRSVVVPETGYAGYGLSIEVKEVGNIDTHIFVYQKEQSSQYESPQDDVFVDVASVEEMEFLSKNSPAANSGFYRVQKIELIFRNAEDRDNGEAKILEKVELLRKSNDAVLDEEEQAITIFPDGAIKRYYGGSTNTSITDQEIIDDLTANKDYARPINVSFPISGLRWVYYAYRNDLGALTSFKVNSVELIGTAILVQRNFVNELGYSSPYRIYKAPAQYPAGTITLEAL